ncbi:I78 family peptidase inhibitor [Pseudoxanthomonas mexicana]|uniref:I78 family peptidase inhibitor n=1 Tax=Pseudoxanthomonas mexicana TaxID=128785 RepID=UPI00398B4387
MTRTAMTALLLCLSLSACDNAPDEQTTALEQSQAAAAEAAQPSTEPPLEAPPVLGSCDDSQAQWAIGKTLTEAEVVQVRTDAKAEATRILKPGQAVTMEYNANRINIEQDEQGVVTAVRCG